MPKKTTKIPRSLTQPKRKLIIKAKFEKNFEWFFDYTHYMFGEIVAEKFAQKVNKSIISLHLMPDANPKNKYRKHTAQKTYRNIIIDKVVITYYVSSTRIVVMDILHSAMSPERFAE